MQAEEEGRKRGILGYCMARTFFSCSKVAVVAKNSEKNKGKKKKRKGDKGNEEEVKRPSYGISASAGTMIRIVHLGSQCGRP